MTLLGHRKELIDDSSEHSPRIINLQKGLHKAGVLQLMQNLPAFPYLFRPSDCKLNIRNLVRLSDPEFFPSDNVLFNLYEHAFGSAYFGIV